MKPRAVRDQTGFAFRRGEQRLLVDCPAANTRSCVLTKEVPPAHHIGLTPLLAAV
ncbi:hypothetical protein OAL27_02075 [Verrucomicrobiales bacterium]|nr:hypothetical protein [Verrucomicrobiales bacterium]